MIEEVQQELAGLYVMGMLQDEDNVAFEAELSHNAELRAEVASLSNATLALARSAPLLAMPAGSLEKLMTSVTSTPIGSLDYRVVRNDDDGWVETPIPGFRVKLLAVSKDIGYETLMVEFAPGTHYPAHLHDHSEQLVVVSGSVQTEGCVLGPGDFIYGEPGSQHQELYSHGGCRALLIRRAA